MNYLIIALALGAVYSLIAVGFALIYSVLNFSNFSHGSLMAVGAFVGYFLIAKFGLHWIPALLLTMLICGLLSMLIELLAYRKLWSSGAPTLFLFVSSITVMLLIQYILSILFKGQIFSFPQLFKKATVSIGSANVPTTYFLMFGVSVFLLALLNLFLHRTRVGIAISAAAADLNTCSLMGVNVGQLVSVVFFISGAIAGCTGVFLGISYTVQAQMGQMVLKGFIASVIGGMGSLSGALLGAFLLALLEVGLNITVGSGYTAVGQFVVVILLLIFRPQGLLGRRNADKV